MPPPRQPRVDWSAVGAQPDWEVPLPVPEGSQPIPPMRFRRIPAGEFWMGSRGEDPSEEPRYRVVIPTEFWLGKYVVTQAEWEAVVRACTPVVERDGNSVKLVPRPSYHDGDRRPVEQVSWDDCIAWCKAWQAFLDREPPPTWDPTWRIGLPSEAQWEYACRAGSETEYWNGDGEAALREIGWFAGNSGFGTHDVNEPVVPGSPERHPAGLVGMHGNVWEWCADAYDAGAYRKREDRWGAAKPWTDEDAAPQEYRSRVVRGGSWDDTAWRCRSACRYWYWRVGRIVIRGFRVCLVRGPGSSSGGSAAAAGEQAEAEQAQQDKASGTRPQSSAAGEAAAPAWEGMKLPPRPPAAQPRARGKGHMPASGDHQAATVEARAVGKAGSGNRQPVEPVKPSQQPIPQRSKKEKKRPVSRGATKPATKPAKKKSAKAEGKRAPGGVVKKPTPKRTPKPASALPKKPTPGRKPNPKASGRRRNSGQGGTGATQ